MAELKRNPKASSAVGVPKELPHWSVVLAAGGATSPAAAIALQCLCQTYSYPLYAWMRRNGYDNEDAKNLTQSFFDCLMERSDLRDGELDAGRFRSFLLASLPVHLHTGRQKSTRDQGNAFSLDGDEAERRYSMEPNDGLPPDKLLERRWASATLDAALLRLRAEFGKGRKARQFELLHPFITQEVPGGAYERFAKQLGLAPGTVSVTLFRLRKRYRELVRSEVSHAIANPADVDQEIENLMSSLSAS